MVRGADFDNGIPQSDNPIEAGETKAHGVGNPVSALLKNYLGFLLTCTQDAPLERTQKVAPMPDTTGSQRDVFSGLGSTNPNNSGSGKGGHEPKSLGGEKGLGAQPGH